MLPQDEECEYDLSTIYQISLHLKQSKDIPKASFAQVLQIEMLYFPCTSNFYHGFNYNVF